VLWQSFRAQKSAWFPLFSLFVGLKLQVPWKLIFGRHIWHTENQLHSIRQIYLSLLSERMPVIVHSEAMILCQMTRFYCNELSTRASSGSFKET